MSGLDEEGKKKPYNLGHFFIVIDTEAFMGSESFKKTTGDILRDLRNSTLAPGQKQIFTAGEKEHITYLERKDKGIPLTKGVQNEFKEVVKMFNLDIELPF